MDQEKKNKQPLWKRLTRIVLKTILSFILLFLVLVLLIQTAPVQNFLRKKLVTYLEKKLDTKVAIGRIYVGLPKNIVIEDIYIEDRKKDTLLAGGKIKANINLWQLAVNNDLQIKSIALTDITAKVKRELPDTNFNFQFIVDAFVPPDTSTTTSASSSSSFAIQSLSLNNLRLVYKDVVTGNDVVAHLDQMKTRIDTLDGVAMNFDVPNTSISGLVAKIIQTKPLANPEPVINDKIEATQPIAMKLGFKEVALEKVDIDYSNDVSAMYAHLLLGTMNVKPENIDLANRVIDLNNISLSQSNTIIRLGKKEQAKVVEQQAEQEVQSQAEAGWTIKVSSIDMENNDFRFDNDNSPRTNRGMDYAHLLIDSLTLKAKDLVLANDTIAANITEGRFSEQSGFVLHTLTTDFSYGNTGASLHNLLIETAGTRLKKAASIRYTSLASLTTDIGSMQVDLDIDESHVLVKDVLTFAPFLQSQPAFANPAATWYINSRITGAVKDLRIQELQLSGLRDTRIDISGHIGGLPNMDNMAADLTIRNASSSRRDIYLFLPKGILPSTITLPSRISSSGKIQGNAGVIRTNLAVGTDLGNALVSGTFSNLNSPATLSYDATVQARSVDIGTIIQNKEAPRSLSTTVYIKGRGTDPATANASFNGTLDAATLNSYTYRGMKFDGTLVNNKATINTIMKDPNIDFNINAIADLSAEFPAVQLTGMIDSIKFQPLHLTPQQIIFRGKLDGNFPVTNPDDLQGRLLLTQTLLVQESQRLQLDTVELSAGRTTNGHFLKLSSEVVAANLEGEYQLTELGNIFQQAIQPYFAVNSSARTLTQRPYDFTLNAYILDNPALKVFVPGLQRIDSVSLESRFSTSNGWTAVIDAPTIDMGANKIKNLKVNAGTNDSNAIAVSASLQQLNAGTAIQLDNTSLTAKLANNTIDFTLNSKDKSLRDKYTLKGLLQQPANGEYTLSVKPDSLVLNYDTWNISPNNKLRINPSSINATDFVLSRSGQQLALNSLGTNGASPLEVNFNSFRLSTVTGFIQTDSTVVNGIVNGKVVFKGLPAAPVFTGDLTINDLSLRNDTVGNVRALINNTSSNAYTTDVVLSGRGNDLQLKGTYYTSASNNLDFDLNIRTLPIATAQAFSNGMLRSSTGSVNGRFSIKGGIDRPAINGDLNFNKAGFNFAMLNSYFTVDGEKISVNKEGLRFNRFEIKDSSQNPLVIDGLAATSNFMNYDFDLDVRANNFRALNSTKKDNRLFYGQLYFNTNLKIKGTEAAPAVDGRLVVNDKTKMTVVLPQREPGIVDRDGIVEFVDFDAPLNDSLFLMAYDSLNTSAFTGMDIAVNIEVSKDAEFSLVIDEGNGDFLNVKGEASLTAGIDPSGKINLNGSYELEQGSYELSFNFLKRKFNIEKGSKIIWEGEPTKATIDISAIYIANTSPLDLVKSQLGEASAFERNTYLQKLPFDVHLNMEGQLLQPTISFDIILPDNKSYVVSGDIINNVRTRLDQLRQEPGEMNKQVFSLLLLNRFIAENPFNSSTGGPNAGALARQSVSKLLTEQLNRLAGDLVAGVNLNFDVTSSEDYTSGERKDRTDLNVGLSKQLLNDRLTVSIGSNFELEGPQNSSQQSSNIAGNVALDYRISKDNRYLLRAYRKNEYQGVIDGYIIETGVGFIITVDYNRFREIFMSRQDREQRRQRRQKQREQDQQQAAPPPPTPAADAATTTNLIQQ